MITSVDLEELFRRSSILQLKHRSLDSIELGEVSNQGYTSKVFRANLIWSELSDDLPDAVIVKLFGNTKLESVEEGPAAEFGRQIRNGHDIECKIYSFLGELGESVPMPRHFGYAIHGPQSRGMLILEDMSPLAGLLPNTDMFSPGLNTCQIDSLLDSLSSLHAWSLNTTTDWRKCIPHLSTDLPATGLAQLAPILLPESQKHHPSLFENVDTDKLLEFINANGFFKIFRDNPKVQSLPTVLVHGDIQQTNIMFRKVNGKPGNEVGALLDWQLAYQGCQIEDLAKMFHWCISAEVRRKEGAKIIERYVQVCSLMTDQITGVH